MKFIIEVNDFFIEEGELSEVLKSHVTHEVITRISASIKDKVEKTITDRIEAAMNEKLKVVIDDTINECIERGVMTVNKQQVNIKDHLRSVFENSHGWNSPSNRMAEIAANFGKELKLQYNNIFATKIVISMKDQGFLKDDMARILLGDK